jgi:hypothetical protein
MGASSNFLIKMLGTLRWNIKCAISLQVFELRDVEDLTEDWLREKLRFFR